MLLSAEGAIPFFLVMALVFHWGIPNNLNDLLIRQFMKSFAITRFQGGLVQSAFYMGCFVCYKAGFLIGLGLKEAKTVIAEIGAHSE